VVSLLLLSAVLVLGLLTTMRVEGRRWPRFLTAAFHRDLSLVALVFLGLHIVTAVVDPFTSLGISAATVPFSSSYRTLWLGLGTVAFELLLAVLITSLLRRAIGARVWRAVHWLAYGSWPIAVVHGVGTGTDSLTPWLLTITAVSVLGVLVAAAWRVAAAPGDPLARHENRGGMGPPAEHLRRPG
jgi:sulfoxide reductase heme-binding subunit YedZ